MARNIVTKTNQDGSLSPKKRGVDLSETFGWNELAEVAADSEDFAEFKEKLAAKAAATNSNWM